MNAIYRQLMILLISYSCHAAIFYTNINQRALLDPNSDRDEISRPYYELNNALIKLDYEVKKFTSIPEKIEKSDAFFFINLPELEYLPALGRIREQCIISIWEPPCVCPYYYQHDFSPFISKILVMPEKLVDDKNYFKFFYPQPCLQMLEQLPDFEEKKLCTLIASFKITDYPMELYSKRHNMIKFFEYTHKQDFEFYGIGWPPSRCYKGTVKSKKDVLKNYRFSICYENTRDLDGYVTEKIFDSLVAGCVPVYRGAGNITQYIPSDCFIDQRNFSNNEELYQFLKNMDKQTYQTYLENIKEYLASEKAYLFSVEYFVDTILSLISPNYQKDLIFNEYQIEMLKKARMYYESIYPKKVLKKDYENGQFKARSARSLE